MVDVDRFLIFVAVGIAIGSLLALRRYGSATVRLLQSIDDKLGKK